MSMVKNRGQFEEQLRHVLDKDLTARGFRLTRQPPGDFDDNKLGAVFETDANEFGERYPLLDGRAGGNTICIDLWFHLDKATGRITSDLDGASLESLMARLGVENGAEPSESLEDADKQLRRLSWQIAAILDAAERR